jgi:hypothetical protein
MPFNNFDALLSGLTAVQRLKDSGQLRKALAHADEERLAKNVSIRRGAAGTAQAPGRQTCDASATRTGCTPAQDVEGANRGGDAAPLRGRQAKDPG